MQTIHSVCGYTHPVWAVSHAGHCATPHSMDMVEGKLHFLLLFRVKLVFFSLRTFIQIAIVEKLQLPLLVIWSLFLLYKVGLSTVWTCKPSNTHVHNSNCFYQGLAYKPGCLVLERSQSVQDMLFFASSECLRFLPTSDGFSCVGWFTQHLLILTCWLDLRLPPLNICPQLFSPRPVCSRARRRLWSERAGWTQASLHPDSCS